MKASQLQDSFRKYFFPIGISCVIFLSLAVLYGWVHDIKILKTLLPGRPDMKANTALCFLVLSVSMWIAGKGPAKKSLRVGLASALATFTLIFSLLVLLEYILHFNLGIDEFLFVDPNGLHGHSPPGRFSPVTAMNFILLSAAVLLDCVPTRPWFRLSQAFFIFSFLLSLQSFLGNVIGLPQIFGMNLFIPMAVHTAFSFTLLTACYLALRSNHGFMKRFTVDSPSALMARRMIVAVIFVPPLIRGFAGAGVQSGLYADEFSYFLEVVGGLLFMSVIVITTAGALFKIEVEREKLRQREMLAYREAETERMKVKRHAEELKIAKEEAEAASLAKSQFLANMSHEIRTPLGVILGFADLAMESLEQREEAAKYISTIRRNGEALSKLIGEVLDLSKVEAQKMEIEKIQFSLMQLTEEVKTLLEIEARSKGIELKVIPKGNLPSTIESDPTRVRQILINLIGNAIKFTESGFVHLEVSYNPGAGSQDGEVVFAVRDTGIGISSENQSRLFQAFVQADSSMTRRFGGTGLGLMLSKELAKALGGDLNLASSEVGKGSLFVARIAAGRVKFKEKQHAAMKAVGSNDSAILPLKILLVEDSEDNQFLIERYLKSAGAEMVIAENGQKGLAALAEKDFDLVLMDIQMPVMDGFQAVKELRARGFTKPVLALTAHAVRAERERALKAGFSGYLTKPIQRKVLIEAIIELVWPSTNNEELEASELSPTHPELPQNSPG